MRKETGMGAKNRSYNTAGNGGGRGSFGGLETSLALYVAVLCRVRGLLGALVKCHKELGCFEFLAARLTATEMDPPSQAPSFTRREGEQLNNQCGLPSGRGKGLACLLPPSLPPAVKSASAGDAQEIRFHLFWAWLVGKPRIQEVTWPISMTEAASGGGRERAHCKGMLSQPWEQLPS